MMFRAILVCLCSAAGTAAAQPLPSEYEVTKVADGVYGFMWKAVPISPEPSVLIVINVDGCWWLQSVRT